MMKEPYINPMYVKRGLSPAYNFLPFQNLCFELLFKVNVTLEKSLCICHLLSQNTLTN